MDDAKRNMRLLDVPAYRAWSKRKLSEGGNEAFIAHLDAIGIWLSPSEVDSISDDVFDELLDDVRQDCE